MRYILLLFFCFLASCASIKPPPGGEEDKTPPSIDTTYPANGTTNVPKDFRPRIFFQLNVDRSTFMQSVTLTPYMAGMIKYDWSGYDEVELQLPEPLRDSTTYILTVGRDLKTLRGGLLNAPIQIIFSTGPTLDSGVISGQVFPAFQSTAAETFTNLFVFAYDLTNRNPDTLNIATTRPDYLTQPNSTGAFELKALKIGHRYRLAAVGDEFRNRLYDHTIDSYGIPTGDVFLTSAANAPIAIRMVPKIDTTHPRIDEVEVRDAYHFRVKFNKAIDSTSVQESNFELLRVGDISPKVLVSAFKEDPEKKPNVITVVPQEMLVSGATYTVHALNNMVIDVHGLPMLLEDAVDTFTVAVVPDTFAPPRLTRFSIVDSARDVSRFGDIRVFFSDAVDHSILDTAFTLFDSTGKNVPIELHYGDASRVTIRARDTLLPKAAYRLEAKGVFIVAALGAYMDKILDTTYMLHFFTEDPRDFGSVSGEITYTDSIYNPAEHRIVVQLVNTETNTKIKKVLSEGRTKFVFETVPPGKYRVRAWLTAMENNSWLGGQIFPYFFAMPTGEYPDLIDVRSRWTVEDVNFELK